MADIFLSYAREDQDRARVFAQAFTDFGWEVFWDPRILPGSSWSSDIEREIKRSKCVVVLWSSASVISDWVKNEATFADRRGILVPVSIADVEPPLGFLHRQSANLQKWQGDLKDAIFLHLLAGIERHAPRSPKVGVPARSRASGRTRRSAARHPAARQAKSARPQSTRARPIKLSNPFSASRRTRPKTIEDARRDYERWLDKQVVLSKRDLSKRHQLMRQSPSAFFRATFYRWLDLLPTICPSLVTAPTVICVGDLTVESFGTWRDEQHRLNWGVRLLDQSCGLPYTSDLVRLATSANLAARSRQLEVTVDTICEEILSGFVASLAVGGRPIVLEERLRWLRKLVLSRARDPKRFWRRVASLPPATTVPPAVTKVFAKVVPTGTYRILRRTAGVGTLGPRRFVAVSDSGGGTTAWEARALPPPALAWFAGHQVQTDARTRILEHAVRNRDPFVSVERGWLLHRLSPESSSIELWQLPRRRDERKLLRAMGWETANIQLCTPSMKTVRNDLSLRRDDWLTKAAKDMTSAVIEDWKAWKT